ncbi:1,5-anhydro-D-fructose reductase [Scedosporium apiospermum]|uniref:1,5-anhydro-D-fructose reductase n=1 Tax=Pseudallescheria apiosperma TaxID=563466 RepID=A0A084GGE5_PSEDA|nr:1,5-anhydro-D-fructose reductase [Scedosporium apiospermum]KEZ46407.1 1,5-anhydro-D-fructose reductase [Scedosporium apiospermum]
MIPPDFFEVNGARIPARGLGTFQPNPEQYGPKSVKQSVLTALKIGYRHIDTSLRYGDGQGEKEVGEAVRESGVPREEIFIVSKLENVYHAPEDVEVNIDISLKNLGLDYVDLFIMHFPYAYKRTENYGSVRDENGRPLIDVEPSRSFDITWRAMERLVDIGKTKYIGLSNFSSPKILRLLQSARIKPICNQIECHPHFPQKGLVKLCQENNIHVTAFGPLGCVPIPALVGRQGPGPLEDKTIAELAKKYSRTAAQIILCYLLCRGISVIPKSNNPKRLAENFDSRFDLAQDDFDVLDNLVGENGERGVRNFNSLEYLGFDNYNEEVEEP